LHGQGGLLGGTPTPAPIPKRVQRNPDESSTQASPSESEIVITPPDGIMTVRVELATGMANDTAEFSPTDWVQDQTKTILETGTTEGLHVLGAPIVLLTLRGAKSGKLRYTPVMRVEHNGSYAVVASKGGAAEHPVWYYNIKAYPEFPLQDGAVTKDYVAREVDGAERAEWWERAVEAYPSYAEYQTKTDRQIPVFVLDPKP
jgi:deazaflavin-dependent oxidoreductase (nitroreductase family)